MMDGEDYAEVQNRHGDWEEAEEVYDVEQHKVVNKKDFYAEDQMHDEDPAHGAEILKIVREQYRRKGLQTYAQVGIGSRMYRILPYRELSKMELKCKYCDWQKFDEVRKVNGMFDLAATIYEHRRIKRETQNQLLNQE